APAHPAPPVAIDVPANDHVEANNVAIATEPQHGTATVQGLIVHYVPDPGFVGPDSLSYTASGCGAGTDCNSDTHLVNITVTGPAPTTTTTTAPTTTTTAPTTATTVA